MIDIRISILLEYTRKMSESERLAHMLKLVRRWDDIMKKKCLLSGNFALDTIVTRDYPNGFVVGKL